MAAPEDLPPRQLRPAQGAAVALLLGAVAVAALAVALVGVRDGGLTPPDHQGAPYTEAHCSPSDSISFAKNESESRKSAQANS